MSELLKLAERCEKATRPDRELHYRIAKALGFVRESDRGPLFLHNGPPGSWSPLRYTASLDAAMTLIPEGWRFAGSETLRGDFYAHLITREMTDTGAKAHAEAHADTLALAICAAALRARASQ